MKTVLVTTTFASSLDDPRFLQDISTCTEAWMEGFPFICVDGSPDSVGERVRDRLRMSGAAVFPQRGRGMGASRRETLRYGLETDAQVIVWLEPEKYPLVALLDPCIELVANGSYDVIVPRRKNLDSYPAYQHWSELRANWELADIIGQYDLDLMFGPRVLSRRAAELFASYVGETPATDQWEILFIPVLRALYCGMRVGSCTVSYIHPPEQTARENGDAAVDRKRDEQRVNLIAAMREEIQKLLHVA
ncbi:MAG: hypothetical protein Q8R30_02270 [bacterium]|nr:hypothetical protein [bacterium]